MTFGIILILRIFFHNHIRVSLQHPTYPPVLGTERHNKYYEAAWNGQV